MKTNQITARAPYQLTGDLVGVIRIEISLDNASQYAALGYGPDEIRNLLGQKLQEILDNLGISDPEGI